MDALTVYVDGIGIWASGIADWPAMRRAIAGERAASNEPASRPSPALLPPTERRRAPEPVLLASEVAGQACAMAERDPATLPCVFASAHGDIAINVSTASRMPAAPSVWPVKPLVALARTLAGKRSASSAASTSSFFAVAVPCRLM